MSFQKEDTTKKKTISLEESTILFAGDSGDGMQLAGSQFSETTALFGNDLNTYPNYPAEIRAPAGTTASVSGFQIRFGSKEVFTSGDEADVLVVMNAAALKSNLSVLKKQGIIIANKAGFDEKNLRLSKYKSNPLEDDGLSGYSVFPIDINLLTKQALKGLNLTVREVNRSKNMFALGLIYWLYCRSLTHTIANLKRKFKDKQDILDGNIRALQAGYNFGEITEIFTSRFNIGAAKIKPGIYRHITGNQATVYGLISASKISNRPLFFGSYPITPASDILHELSKHKNFGIKTFQAEDEISSIGCAIGASFAGSLAATATSGPGLDLKTEAMGLAISMEIPLVIIDVQRGGPSTGLPTKTEQSDLFSALYGRHGESPLIVMAASSPSNCYDIVYHACKLAMEHMTPVICLTDGYIANGTEPWAYKTTDSLPPIKPNFAKPLVNGQAYMPYQRNKNLVRSWAIPGMKGLEHRVGGLEKEDVTGNVSYDPENHQKMTHYRKEKIQRIANVIPPIKIETGKTEGNILILGWGGTFGNIKSATLDLIKEGYSIGHAHIHYLNPLPANLGELISKFKKVVVVELNTGQLNTLIRSTFLTPTLSLNKVQGQPFKVQEIKEFIVEHYR